MVFLYELFIHWIYRKHIVTCKTIWIWHDLWYSSTALNFELISWSITRPILLCSLFISPITYFSFSRSFQSELISKTTSFSMMKLILKVNNWPLKTRPMTKCIIFFSSEYKLNYNVKDRLMDKLTHCFIGQSYWTELLNDAYAKLHIVTSSSWFCKTIPHKIWEESISRFSCLACYTILHKKHFGFSYLTFPVLGGFLD